MSAPVLSGDLRAIPLADVLHLLNSNLASGTLRCARGGLAKTIEWEKGAIVFARSTAPEDRLGSYLVARGKLTTAQIEKAAPMVGDQERLGKALVRLGLLTPSELWEAVRAQITEIVYSLFHWKDGAFDFREGRPPAEKINLDTGIMNIIMEATRRVDEWSRIKAKIQSDRVILAPLKSLEEVARSVRLSEFERAVLGLVDARRTVRDIVGLAGRSDFDTWQALYSLLSAGLIRVQLVAFDQPEAAAGAGPADDGALDRTIDRYGDAVGEILARAVAKGGAAEAARLRKRLREATFEQADLLKEAAIEPDGRIDRHLLLANVAEYPPGDRERLLRGALERLLGLLADELKGTVAVDDVVAKLKSGG